MKKKYTKYFGISFDDLAERKVFNGYIDRDSRYYIVPYKLENLEIPEFKDSYEKFKDYFRQMVKLLNKAKEPSKQDTFYKNVVKKFIFHEIGHIGLGYSKSGKAGSGIGEKIALELAKTAFDMVKAGIEDPEFFQIMELLEKGIGQDRISDMTLSILQDDFCNYTQRVALDLKLKTKKYGNFLLPFGKDEQPIIFCPTPILSKLRINIDASDIESICSDNERLRSKVNKILQGAFDEGRKDISKSEVKNVIFDEPRLIYGVYAKYKEKYSTYDFIKDPDGDIIWERIAYQTVGDYPLRLSKNLSVEEVVDKICNQYKNVIENKGLWKEFHNDDGTCKKESFAQNLFYAMALSYCEANDLDISPESNAGNGPVDFKISKGATQKILVEMKLSSNSKLVSSYIPQNDAYKKAENALANKYVVVQVDEKHEARIQKLYDKRNERITEWREAPEIIVIDATKKESASKR